MATQLRTDEAKRTQRSASLRTALILVSIAAVFFGGIIVSQYFGGNAVGIGVVGLAIIGFLLVTVGRRLRGESSNAERE